MKYNIFLIALMGLFLISFASASYNVKEYIPDATTGYGSIDIINWWGLPLISEKLQTIELKENNGIQCGEYCNSILNITIFKKDIPAIDGVKFITMGDKYNTTEPIINYTFYRKIGEEVKTIDAFIYTCSNYTEINGSITLKCNNEKNGTIKQITPLWKEYNEGELLPIGNYIFKLEGRKDKYKSVDWIVTSQGLELTEWATWGGLTNFRFYNNTLLAKTGDSSKGANSKNGIRILVGPSDVYLSNVTKGATDSATHALLENSTHSQIVNSSFVGRNASFSYTLKANTTYYIMGYSASAWFSDYKTAPAGTATFPSAEINFTGGWDGGDNNLAYSIWGVTLGDSGSILTINSPVNYYNATKSNVGFNCSAVVNGASFFNMTLFTNLTGSFAITNTTTINGGNITYNISAGGWKWGCYACDNSSSCAFSENRTVYGCVLNMTYTDWSSWVNQSCVGTQRNQSRNRIQYDSTNCESFTNVTTYETRLADTTYINTTWTTMINQSCVSGQMNQTQNFTRYDLYSCASNITVWNTTLAGPILLNTNWTNLINESCEGDQMNQTRNYTTYDLYQCIANVTTWDTHLVGPSWILYGASNWTDVTSCAGTALAGFTKKITMTTNFYDYYHCASNITGTNDTRQTYCDGGNQDRTNFFDFWAGDVWGSVGLSILGSLLLYLFICMISRIGLYTTLILLALPLFTFSTLSFGMIAYLPIFIISLFYFATQLISWLQARGRI